MRTLQSLFGVEKPLIGMCHLPGLPGRPRHERSATIEAISQAVLADVRALQEGGVDGLLFCNENDIPYQLEVGHEVSTAMAATVAMLKPHITKPFGVDILWDPEATLAVARATGATFVREVFAGVFESDMGLMAPDMGALAAYRETIGASGVVVFTNVTPEFSTAIGKRSVEDRVRSAVYMGFDGILISGQMAGVGPAERNLSVAREAANGVPVLANTGVRHDTVDRILAIADGLIVGTSLKLDGVTWNPVDPERVRTMMDLVFRARSRTAEGHTESEFAPNPNVSP